MIIKSHTSGWNWFQGEGVHTTEVHCDSCTCKYHIQKGDEIYWFDDYQSAEAKWNELTNTQPFRLGKDKWE